jgi:hypothetical protein
MLRIFGPTNQTGNAVPFLSSAGVPTVTVDTFRWAAQVVITRTFNAIVATFITWCGSRPYWRIVKPSSFVDALIDSANVIGFDNLALRRAAEEADTKTLSEVIIATLVFGRPAAIIIGINVGPFLPACLRCYALGSIAGELIGVWLEQQMGGFEQVQDRWDYSLGP